MAVSSDQWPTLGIEEEYFLVDADTGAPVAAGSAVLRRARETMGDLVSGEFTDYQIEAKTPPCTTLHEIYSHTARMRAAVSAAAAVQGLRILASGTPVTGPYGPVPVRDTPRDRESADTYRAVADELAVCALHTHVEVPGLEQALLVGNHLRPWLPVLVALAANSPFRNGRDTGYASWRTMATSLLPMGGPPPYFACVRDYDRLVATLRHTGSTVDEGTLFWDVRPCVHLPTVEIRAMDVVADAREAAGLAALVRALVVTALSRVQRGDPGPRLSDPVLRAAYWRAARDGCGGQAIDVRGQCLVPAPEMTRRLLEHVRPVLERYGELRNVTAVLRQLTACGGAERQRQAFARGTGVRDVVDEMTRQTSHLPEHPFGAPPMPSLASTAGEHPSGAPGEAAGAAGTRRAIP
jgi:carboxylate-amine ligase